MSNAIECPASCGGQATVKEGTKGSLSVSCSSCGYQGFAKSPKAVAALRARLGQAPAPAPANNAPAAKKPDGFIEAL